MATRAAMRWASAIVVLTWMFGSGAAGQSAQPPSPAPAAQTSPAAQPQEAPPASPPQSPPTQPAPSQPATPQGSPSQPPPAQPQEAPPVPPPDASQTPQSVPPEPAPAQPASAQAAQPNHRGSTLSIEITSPLGRTGISGAVRIVARVTAASQAVLSKVTFYLDGKPVGEDTDGPPYAVEWLDENPFEAREITAQVADSFGNTAKDRIVLKPLEIVESTQVSGVLVEPLVLDEKNHSVKGLTKA